MTEQTTKTQLGLFKIVAALEGISFLLLLCVAMPLKYIWGQPWMVQQVGMAHGLLFVGYILLVVYFRSGFGWNTKQTAIALIASTLPLGTFYVTAKMLPRQVNG